MVPINLVWSPCWWSSICVIASISVLTALVAIELEGDVLTPEQTAENASRLLNCKLQLNYSLPTTTGSLRADIPALFPALILTWREHISILWGRLKVKSATGSPGWCCLVVSFKILPAEDIRVMRKNSGILLVHTVSTCRLGSMLKL